MRRHVLTLSEEDFRSTVGRLQGKVLASDFTPDAVLSIRRGGEFVGNLMFPGTPHYAVTLQRGSTQYKNKIFAMLLRHMPRFILDQLRIFESWVMSKRKTDATVLPIITLPDLSCHHSILIVDDAVDSGVTLSLVRDRIISLCPRAEVKTAAITITTGEPMVIPDFYIYHNYTLIRFPWSSDSPGR